MTQSISWNAKLNKVWDKSFYLIDFNIYKTINEHEEYRRKIIQSESSLTVNEKNFLIKELQSYPIL